MFKTFAQILLSLAVSLGLVAGFNPDAHAKLSAIWHKAEATIHEVTDSVVKTADGVSTNTQVAAGAQADASAQAQEKVEINSAAGLNSGLKGLIDGGASAEGSANVGVEANGSVGLSSGGSFLDFLFKGSLHSGLGLWK